MAVMETDGYDEDDISSDYGSGSGSKEAASGKDFSWFGQSRFWTMMSLVLVCVFLCSGLGIVSFLGAIGAGAEKLRSTEIFEKSLTIASTNSEVLAEVGAPIEPGKYFRGRADENAANFSRVKLTGPKGEARMTVTALKDGPNPWGFSTFEVELPSGKTLDLRP